MRNKEVLCKSLLKFGGYTKVPNKIYTMNLSVGAISTYTYLLSGAEDYMPSAATIAKHLNISRPTVKVYLKELEDKNIIKPIKEGYKNSVNRYEFINILKWSCIEEPLTTIIET